MPSGTSDTLPARPRHSPRSRCVAVYAVQCAERMPELTGFREMDTAPIGALLTRLRTTLSPGAA